MKSKFEISLKATILVALVLSFAFSGSAFGALIGTDNAAQSVYNDGWQTGDDGAATGDAFLAWNLTTQGTSGNAGHFIGDSTSLSSPGADINTSGESFGMFGHGFDGNGNAQANAFRDFNGGALSNGQTFSAELAVNFRNGFKGIDLRDGGGATIFNFNVAGDDYVVTIAASGTGSIGNAYSSNTEFLLEFTQTSGTGGNWKITRSGGVSDVDTGTYLGLATGFKLYIGGTTGGSNAPDDLYANSLSIIPEPSSLVLAGFGLAFLGVVKRRRS